MADGKTTNNPGVSRAAAGPAGGILHAAAQLADAFPLNHEEMRALLFDFDYALNKLAEGFQIFQGNQVNRGFHPATMAPLSQTVGHLQEGRVFCSYTIMAIERHYDVNFQAAQNRGPGEEFFGAQTARPQQAKAS